MINSSNRKKWNVNVEHGWTAFYTRIKADGLVPLENEVVLKERKRGNRYFLRWSAVAALCILFVGFAYLYWPLFPSTEMIAIQNVNDSEVLVTTLEDGSVVFLSGNSTLTYPRIFTSDHRRVSLEGEAFFEVNSESARSFIIETELITVEVMGTSFRIRAQDERSFELTVKSGVVKVTLNNEEQEVFVEAGEHIQLISNWFQKTYVDNIDVLSQNVHTFCFKDETLGEIIRVVNNHTMEEVKLVLDNESLANRVITVSFDLYTENMSKIAALICETLGFKFTIGENIIVISK